MRKQGQGFVPHVNLVEGSQHGGGVLRVLETLGCALAHRTHLNLEWVWNRKAAKWSLASVPEMAVDPTRCVACYDLREFRRQFAQPRLRLWEKMAESE